MTLHDGNGGWFRSLLERLTGRSRSKAVSEEEITQILEEGERSGAIDRTEHELIKSIFEFTDTTVKEIMVPRTDVFAVDIATPRDRMIQMLIDQGYTRVPVYRDTIDRIVGIIYTKDLLGVLEHRDLILLQDILRPPYMVPESKKISVLLRELQKNRQHMAIVIDEFGGTEGIITIEDIVEEIVGEIRDEYDEESSDVVTHDDGSVFVNGGITIHDFNARFRTDVPEHADYDTISGFLHTLAGRLPELHEEIRYKNVTFIVAKKNERRIRSLRIKFGTAVPEKDHA
ncbi:MAG: HlyC/CorC family transporter [Bacteroidetes bacterium]|nr:MAG: HlyC/CorC family transporter [Bacteroidota bacterium]